jgi:hypothetical protein
VAGHTRHAPAKGRGAVNDIVVAMCALCAQLKVRRPKPGEPRVSIVTVLVDATEISHVVEGQGGRCIRCGHVVDDLLAVVTRVER